MKDRLVEINAAEKNKEKRMKRNEDSLRDPWDNIRCTNIHIIGIKPLFQATLIFDLLLDSAESQSISFLFKPL